MIYQYSTTAALTNMGGITTLISCCQTNLCNNNNGQLTTTTPAPTLKCYSGGGYAGSSTNISTCSANEKYCQVIQIKNSFSLLYKSFKYIFLKDIFFNYFS